MSLPPSYNIFERYPAHTLVETGSYRGDGIRLAIDAGYKQVRSIDIMREQVEFCMRRFRMRSNGEIVDGKCIVGLFEGDSSKMLIIALKDVTNDCTVFLDAHTQWLEDEPEMKVPFPLRKELEQIKKSGIKPKNIFIDDIMFLTHPFTTGWTLDDIQSWVSEIGEYKFELIANPVRMNFLICTYYGSQAQR